MHHWTEMRTAYLVAKLGTVSAAAEELGVHRATVNRHIDTLEQALGAALFHRHARGYTPTDVGRDMLETAGRVEELFASLSGRTRGRRAGLSGDLIVSALSGAAPLVMPSLSAFHVLYPEVDLHFVADSRLARLEYGEAHVAIRAGHKPQEPDYVVIPFYTMAFGLYAHSGYIERHGRPVEFDDLRKHRFVGSTEAGHGGPHAAWLAELVPPASLSIHVKDMRASLQAVLAGMGIGFLANYEVADHGELIEVVPPRADWRTRLWIVTHRDLHRTQKVQEIVRLLKSRSDSLEGPS